MLTDVTHRTLKHKCSHSCCSQWTGPGRMPPSGQSHPEPFIRSKHLHSLEYPWTQNQAAGKEEWASSFFFVPRHSSPEQGGCWGRNGRETGSTLPFKLNFINSLPHHPQHIREIFTALSSENFITALMISVSIECKTCFCLFNSESKKVLSDKIFIINTTRHQWREGIKIQPYSLLPHMNRLLDHYQSWCDMIMKYIDELLLSFPTSVVWDITKVTSCQVAQAEGLKSNIN